MQDDDSQLKLYLAHRTALVDYATPLVGDRTRAEDLVQEAYLRFRPAGSGQRSAIEQPVAYLYRIVRNLALDWVRRRPVEARHQQDESLHWLRPAAPRTPEEELTYRQELRRVAEILGGLSEEARIAVEMHRFGGYTLQEIAARLDISVTSAHRLVKEAVLLVALGLDPEQ